MPSECWALQDELAEPNRCRPTLPELCQSLHEFMSGSSPDMDVATEVKIVHILEVASTNWAPTAHSKCEEYDNAVLNLIKVTLKEYEQYIHS